MRKTGRELKRPSIPRDITGQTEMEEGRREKEEKDEARQSYGERERGRGVEGEECIEQRPGEQASQPREEANQ